MCFQILYSSSSYTGASAPAVVRLCVGGGRASPCLLGTSLCHDAVAWRVVRASLRRRLAPFTTTRPTLFVCSGPPLLLFVGHGNSLFLSGPRA